MNGYELLDWHAPYEIVLSKDEGVESVADRLLSGAMEVLSRMLSEHLQTVPADAEKYSHMIGVVERSGEILDSRAGRIAWIMVRGAIPWRANIK